MIAYRNLLDTVVIRTPEQFGGGTYTSSLQDNVVVRTNYDEYA